MFPPLPLPIDYKFFSFMIWSLSYLSPLQPPLAVFKPIQSCSPSYFSFAHWIPVRSRLIKTNLCYFSQKRELLLFSDRRWYCGSQIIEVGVIRDYIRVEDKSRYNYSICNLYVFDKLVLLDIVGKGTMYVVITLILLFSSCH